MLRLPDWITAYILSCDNNVHSIVTLDVNVGPVTCNQIVNWTLCFKNWWSGQKSDSWQTQSWYHSTRRPGKLKHTIRYTVLHISADQAQKHQDKLSDRKQSTETVCTGLFPCLAEVCLKPMAAAEWVEIVSTFATFDPQYVNRRDVFLGTQVIGILHTQQSASSHSNALLDKGFRMTVGYCT